MLYSKTIRKWIRNNSNWEANPGQALQYCRILQQEFPDLDIIKGVVFFDRSIDEKENFPGLHYWCKERTSGEIHDVSEGWFDKVHGYKELEVYKRGGVDV
jgi:hypothetical protein